MPSATIDSGRGNGKSRSRSRNTALTTETILDIIESLGVVDLITSRLRAKLEQADFDDVLDDVRRYVRRNPEVLVVALAAITVSAGLIVYLDSRHEHRWDEDEEEITPSIAAHRATAPRSRRTH